MHIKHFILAGEVDDTIRDTDALLEAARHVPLNEWDDVIIEAEDGRYYRLAIPDAGLEHMTEAALRVHLRRLSRECGDHGIYAAVFGSSQQVSPGGGLQSVLAELLEDVLAEYSLEDVRAALDAMGGSPLPIKRHIHFSELELDGDWAAAKDTEELLKLAGRALDEANTSEIFGPVAFQAENGKFYHLRVAAFIEEQTREQLEEVFGPVPLEE